MKNPSGLLNALDEPIFELSLEGKVIAATAAAQALAGRATTTVRDAVDEWKFATIVAVRDRARFEQAFKRLVDAKTISHRMEIDIVARQALANDIVPMEAKLAAVTAANGKPTSVGVGCATCRSKKQTKQPPTCKARICSIWWKTSPMRAWWKVLMAASRC